MADVKISALPASTTPLAGTEVLPIVQSSTTKQVSVADLTAGRAVSALSLTSTTTLGVTGTSTLSGNAIISVTDNTNAALRITQLGTGNALLVEDTTNPDASPFVVAADGDVFIGSSTSIPGAFSDTGKLQVSQNSGEAVQQNFSFVNSTNGSFLYLNKSRSGTLGTNTIVQSGDNLGGLVFAGADGTTYHRAAQIAAEVDGTPGTNDMPGRLIFSTTADGASSPTERMRISSTGLLTVTNGAVIQGLTVGLGANAVGGNTAVGVSALASGSLSGASNVAVGNGALQSNTTGYFNEAVGQAALQLNTTGVQNVAIGAQALLSNISGTNNAAVGVNALQVNTGGGNVGVGFNSGNALTTGNNNTIIGSVAGTAGLSDTVIIAAGAAERMRIDSSGVISYTGSLTVSAYTETIVASGTVGASATLAITAGTVLTATLTSATACTFTMPTATAGKSFILLLNQPASGTATTATFTGVKFNASGAPTITATVGKMDILTFVSDGTNWYGSYSQGYTP